MWLIACVVLCGSTFAQPASGNWFMLGQDTLCDSCTQCEPYPNEDGHCAIDRGCDQIKFDTKYEWSPDGTLTQLYIAAKVFLPPPRLPLSVAATSVLIEARGATGHFAPVYTNEDPVNCTLVEGYGVSVPGPISGLVVPERPALIQAQVAPGPGPGQLNYTFACAVPLPPISGYVRASTGLGVTVRQNCSHTALHRASVVIAMKGLIGAPQPNGSTAMGTGTLIALAFGILGVFGACAVTAKMLQRKARLRMQAGHSVSKGRSQGYGHGRGGGPENEREEGSRAGGSAGGSGPDAQHAGWKRDPSKAVVNTISGATVPLLGAEAEPEERVLPAMDVGTKAGSHVNNATPGVGFGMPLGAPARPAWRIDFEDLTLGMPIGKGAHSGGQR